MGTRADTPDRITDELSGSVVGHVPAAVDGDELGPDGLRVGEDVVRIGVGAQRVHRRVFEEEQDVVV